jgi:hypothetical protein
VGDLVTEVSDLVALRGHGLAEFGDGLAEAAGLSNRTRPSRAK